MSGPNRPSAGAPSAFATAADVSPVFPIPAAQFLITPAAQAFVSFI